MNTRHNDLAAHADALGGPALRAWPRTGAGRLRPHKGGGGDGGAAQMEVDRQNRVTAAINQINSIFDGGAKSGVNAAQAFDPNQTYYQADGSQFVAPTKTTTEYGAPVMQEAGETGFSEYRPSTTKTGIDMDAINRALQSGSLFTGVKDTPDNTRGAMYDQQRQAVTDVNARDVSRQFEDTSRTNKFGLARNGLLGGSVDVDSNAELQRRRNEGLIKSAGLGDQAAADLQTADERTRQNLISMAQTGIDTGQAGSLALTGLEANSKNAQSAASGASVGSLFGDLSNAYLMNQQSQGIQAGLQPYQRNLGNNVRTGGFTGNVK